MFNPPKTLEEAKEIRYGEWSGNPKGLPYRLNKCAYEVFVGYLSRQCWFNNGKGINNLYCGIHAKKIKN